MMVEKTMTGVVRGSCACIALYIVCTNVTQPREGDTGRREIHIPEYPVIIAWWLDVVGKLSSSGGAVPLFFAAL